MQDFRRLRVWRNAHALALNVDRVARAFPRTGFATAKARLSAAADSIAANIVEGCGAATQKEFARFIDIAIRSATELEYHLILSRDRALIVDPDWQALTIETIQLRRMLYALRKRINTDLSGSSVTSRPQPNTRS